MQPFGYKSEPLTCLWCGRKFTEYHDDMIAGSWDGTKKVAVPPPIVGASWRGKTIARVVPAAHGRKLHDGYKTLTKLRPARSGEEVDYYWIYFDPPVYKTWVGPDQEPKFDTLNCAAQFGQRQAELGNLLRRKP